MGHPWAGGRELGKESTKGTSKEGVPGDRSVLFSTRAYKEFNWHWNIANSEVLRTAKTPVSKHYSDIPISL